MEFDLPAAQPVVGAPIADLSYQPYTGPLQTRAIRWWIVAVAMLRMNLRSVGFKVTAALSFLPYFIALIWLFVQTKIPSGRGGQGGAAFMGSFIDFTPGQKYSIQFYNALGYQLLFLLVITLFVGAGSIASDNRSNALMVYLSKPITKGDYLLGKWFSLFLTIFAVTFLPALFLYLYCLAAYTGDGFLREEPRLFWHMLVATALPGLLLSSLMIGISAWSRSSRIAGAILAGIYFASQTIAVLVWRLKSKQDPSVAMIPLHSSIGGIISGLSQKVYGITIHTMMAKRGLIINIDIPPPPPAALLIMAGILIAGGILAARVRIQAVEVVRG